MAPEVWLMQRATQATDLYAVGVMLYEALTGDLPFSGDLNALRQQHLYGSVPRAKANQPWIPDLVDGAMKKLLAKDPRDRYQSAGELLTTLEAAVPAPNAQIAGLADRMRRHHDHEEANELKEKRAAELADDSDARTRYKEGELLSLADDFINELNAQLAETKVQIFSGDNSREYRFGRRTLAIWFFQPGQLYRDPIVPGRMTVLREKHLVQGGVIEIREDNHEREGWNVVLLRAPGGLYGEWRLIETRASALTRQAPHFEPFATEANLLADNLACHWSHTTHTTVLSEEPLDREHMARIFDYFIP